MGKTGRGLQPQVEAVESRALLSGGIVGASAVVAAVSSDPVRFIHLHGTLRGNYVIPPGIPDVGKTYVTTGSGHVRGLGHASVTGDLHGLGFVFQGHAQGDVTLAGARGTLTLHLTGVPQQGGFAGLPSVFSFSITGGTGKYKRVHESGTATLAMVPGQAASEGTFTLVLTPRAIPL